MTQATRKLVHYYAHDPSDGNSVPPDAETACAISIRHGLAFPTFYGSQRFVACAVRAHVTCPRCIEAMCPFVSDGYPCMLSAGHTGVHLIPKPEGLLLEPQHCDA